MSRNRSEVTESVFRWTCFISGWRWFIYWFRKLLVPLWCACTIADNSDWLLHHWHDTETTKSSIRGGVIFSSFLTPFITIIIKLYAVPSLHGTLIELLMEMVIYISSFHFDSAHPRWTCQSIRAKLGLHETELMDPIALSRALRTAIVDKWFGENSGFYYSRYSITCSTIQNQWWVCRWIGRSYGNGNCKDMHIPVILLFWVYLRHQFHYT